MLNHQGTELLETERLLLRPFDMADVQAMYDNWASDPEVTKYLTWPAHGAPGLTKIILQDWTESYVNSKFYQWAIVPKTLGQPIGSIGVVNLDEQVESAHVGYCIGHRWWHQGYTSEALQAVLDFLFDSVGFQRIDAKHDARNPHSGDVMKKCGMVYEGTHRRSVCNTSGLADAVWYAILAEDRH